MGIKRPNWGEMRRQREGVKVGLKNFLDEHPEAIPASVHHPKMET